MPQELEGLTLKMAGGVVVSIPTSSVDTLLTHQGMPKDRTVLAASLRLRTRLKDYRNARVTSSCKGGLHKAWLCSCLPSAEKSPNALNM